MTGQCRKWPSSVCCDKEHRVRKGKQGTVLSTQGRTILCTHCSTALSTQCRTQESRVAKFFSPCLCDAGAGSLRERESNGALGSNLRKFTTGELSAATDKFSCVHSPTHPPLSVYSTVLSSPDTVVNSLLSVQYCQKEGWLFFAFPLQKRGFVVVTVCLVSLEQYCYCFLVSLLSRCRKDCIVSEGGMQSPNVVYRGRLRGSSEKVAVKRFFKAEREDWDELLVSEGCSLSGLRLRL